VTSLAPGDTESRVRAGRIDPHAAQALAGLLGRPAGTLDVLPPMWHITQLLDAPAQADVGPDGHPLTGLPVPPGPGMRRMFAGGLATHLRPLVVGEEAVRTSREVSREHKAGRSGPLTFVTVRHEVRQHRELAVIDDHEIVYRPATGPTAPLARTAGDAPTEGRIFDVDPVVLFRFSALTFNAHRIHYDRDHAAAEGYADLVVHGPLQALLMAEELNGLLGKTMTYRLVAPAIGPQRLVVRRPGGEGADADVLAGNGVVVARAWVSEP
jgi:3-methylfumaryl-CoA hydratase